jgi:hypothetical protein
VGSSYFYYGKQHTQIPKGEEAVKSLASKKAEHLFIPI